MPAFPGMSGDDLRKLRRETASKYAELKELDLNLHMERGSPAPEQCGLSNELLTILTESDYRTREGVDCRNYGLRDGIPELREIFSEVLHVPVEQLLAGDNSSLAIMLQVVQFACLFGVEEGATPWSRRKAKCIVLVPSYDFHFNMMDGHGIELISVPYVGNRPDIARIRTLVANDPDIVAMWIIPMHSNPTGTIFSESELRDLLSMKTAAKDFRLLVDNAYAVHHLTDEEPPVIDILGLASAEGNPDRVMMFASTSKMTMPGSGVGFFASSPKNIEWYRKYLALGVIGPNKINQLRQARFFKNAEGVRAQMRRHRKILAPRFATVLDTFSSRLGQLGVAEWTQPTGGYFVSLYTAPGTAARTIELAGEVGIHLLPAGANYPYGKDADDRHIRIAPSVLPEEKLAIAIDGISTCVILASLEKHT